MAVPVRCLRFAFNFARLSPFSLSSCTISEDRWNEVQCGIAIGKHDSSSVRSVCFQLEKNHLLADSLLVLVGILSALADSLLTLIGYH